MTDWNAPQRTEDDERARLDALARIAAWAFGLVPLHPDVCIVAYGSVVRGDYSAGSDLDLIVIAPVQATAHAIAASAIGILSDVGETPWDVEAAYFTNLLATPSDQRAFGKGYPIQFGLHGFDTIGHHHVFAGRHDLLVRATVPLGNDLAALGRERLRMVTPPVVPDHDGAPKRAVEAIKAAVILACARIGRAPTRHKELVPILFETLVPLFPGKNVWRWIWTDYRTHRQTLTDDTLNEFITSLVGAMAVR